MDRPSLDTVRQWTVEDLCRFAVNLNLPVSHKEDLWKMDKASLLEAVLADVFDRGLVCEVFGDEGEPVTGQEAFERWAAREGLRLIKWDRSTGNKDGRYIIDATITAYRAFNQGIQWHRGRYQQDKK